MHPSDFSYRLPETLIAQYPAARRTQSRLLLLDPGSGALDDRLFNELPSLLSPGDLLVFNDTRVVKARLCAHKPTGGQVEVLVERVINGASVWAQIRANKALKAEASLLFQGGIKAQVLGRSEDLFELRFEQERDPYAVMQAIGQVPLPPYIRRSAVQDDELRYQTVFARVPGAVAAPTAGLHFDSSLLDTLRRGGVNFAFVTLHVGYGTFQPLRVEQIEDHRLHKERVEVPAQTCALVMEARRDKKRVIAVGTTVVRALETAAKNGTLKPLRGETDLFIFPGYGFRCVDAMITNFHLPESSLLMLVCAFAGRERVLSAYGHAVAQEYRFFSYGDAMFIAREEAPDKI
ncbi:MAG: tRNA preQ1(34) S-adenosylmethionine ribosyltransferase-isomerase QueA [Gammaproteobacteria bacterium]